MADPSVFEWGNPATWIPSIVAGAAGIYGLFRILRRDRRNDNQEQLIDAGVQQLITNLRAEVDRLTGRVESMEEELVQLHEERLVLLKKVAELEPVSHQTKLF
jgi:transposase